MDIKSMSNDQLIYRLGYYQKERDEANFEIRLIMNEVKERSVKIREEVKMNQSTVEKVTEKQGGIF